MHGNDWFSPVKQAVPCTYMVYRYIGKVSRVLWTCSMLVFVFWCVFAVVCLKIRCSEVSLDGKAVGGFIGIENIDIPYVLMNSFKFVMMADVNQIFSQCNKRCKITKSVIKNYSGLLRSFCNWEQVCRSMCHLDILTLKTPTLNSDLAFEWW